MRSPSTERGEMYQGGYTGKILRIDLTEKTYKEEPLPEDVAKDFMGAAGFCIKYIFDEVPGDADPLGPENKLVYAVGPFTGTGVPCTSRMAIGAKSPGTGAMGLCMTGGYFPLEFKRAGYDAVIIEGKAEVPTYLWIKNGKVTFRSAADQWGLMTSDCQQSIRDELGDQNIRVSCIGPAGEKLSKIACIINERRAAGRKGLGAVMGSKNLKAIALRGDMEIGVADPENFEIFKKRFRKRMKDSPALYPHFAKVGTSGNFDNVSALGILPAKNFTATGQFLPSATIGPDALKSRGVGRIACAECPVRCSQMRLAKEQPYAGILAEGPEFESLYAFGSMCGVDNPDAIIAADRMCDEFGLDTISAGVIVAWVMEAYERGILTKQDTHGMDLSFGQHESMVRLIHMMGERQGLGDLLADGVKIAAEKIGKGSEKFAFHVKGLEFPGYDVRGAKAYAVAFATSYTGADHNKGYAIQEIFGVPVPYAVDRLAVVGKGKLTKWNQDWRTAIGDAPAICIFPVDMATGDIALENTADLLRAITGMEWTPDSVYEVGERINNVARAFNTLAGFTRADDDLPERLKTEAIQEGPCKGQSIPQEDLDLMIDEFYEARGWAPDGIPSRAKLEELRLGYVADRLGQA